MTFFQSLVLGIVQGITEFLPISSKGHLNLFAQFLGISPTLSFDIFLNTATLISVLFYFRHHTLLFLKNLSYIFVGSVPAIISGFLLKSRIELLVARVNLLPYFFLITTAYLLTTRFLPQRNQPLNYFRALVVGFFQLLALLPGVSRSGSTIFAGLLMGLSPRDSFNFSFGLFIPVSLGALVLDLKTSQIDYLSLSHLVSFIVALITGIIAITLLQKLLISNKIWCFGIYTLLLSLTLLFWPF